MAKLSLISTVLGIISVVHAKPPQRIVGGDLASAGEIPYIVSLSLNGNHFCGGSIISNRHILTAAHCVADLTRYQRRLVRLRTGCISTKNGGSVYRVEKIETHPKYNESSSATPNDIAVIKVSEPITFNKNTTMIRLIDAEPEPDTPVIASGWGLRTARDRSVPTDLFTVRVKIAKQNVCQKSYPVKILNSHVCTIGPVGQGVCRGDSGGPLELRGRLAGVVSFGKPCARGEADVFTNVYHFRDWIRSVMTEL